MKYDEIIIGKMVIPLILNLSPPESCSDLYFADDNKIFFFSPVDGKEEIPAPGQRPGSCPAPQHCSCPCLSWPGTSWIILSKDHADDTDLGVPGAPAAPDQRAEVLEAENWPPVEGEVTHTDESHAHQVHQVKLKWDKLWSLLEKFQR